MARTARDDHTVDVLLREYEFCRIDDRHAESSTIALLAVLFAVGGAFVALLASTCPDISAGSCRGVSDWVWASIPLAPLGLAAYIVQIGSATLIRRYYMRAIERRLIDLVDVRAPLNSLRLLDSAIERPDPAPAGTDPGSPVPIPASVHLAQVVTSPTRAEWLYRTLNYFLYVGLVAVVTLLTVLAVWQIDDARARAALLGGYAVVGAAITVAIYGATVGRRNLWQRAREELGRRLEDGLYGAPQS